MSHQFSDEILHTYVDGELDQQERGRIMEAASRDKGLSDRICRLQKVQEMVQLAYHLEDDAIRTRNTPDKNAWRPGIAAALVLLVGTAAGWLAHSNFGNPPTLSELASSTNMGDTLAKEKKTWRLMLHVNTDDQNQLNTLLDETEQLLATSRQQHRPVQVEILTNGPGLKLLQAVDSPITQRLTSLTRRYDNLALLACSKAIQKLKQEKGIDIKLIPEARVVESALHQAIKRQQSGWSYLRI